MAKGGDNKGQRRNIAATVAMKCLASSNTVTGEDNRDDNDGNSNCHLLSNKRLKATDNGSKGSGCKSDGEDCAKIVEGERDAGDNNDGDMDLVLKMMDARSSMLFSHPTTSAMTNITAHHNKEERVQSWAAGQLPMVLCCIGNGGDTTVK